MCCNVSNHKNISLNGSSEADDRIGFITNRDSHKNGVDKLTRSQKSLNDSGDEDDDSISSNSMSVFKRNEKVQPKDGKTSVEDLIGFDPLKTSKQNDDFFNFTSGNKNEEKQKMGSSLGDLPPLNQSNNFQNSMCL